MPATAEVATRLDIDEGSDVVVRRLTFWLEDMPVALHDGYFPADLVAGTAIEPAAQDPKRCARCHRRSRRIHSPSHCPFGGRDLGKDANAE
jgi:hypothetical protein